MKTSADPQPTPPNDTSKHAADKKSRAAVKPKKTKKAKRAGKQKSSEQQGNGKKIIIRQVFAAVTIMLLLLGSAIAVTQQINQYRQSFTHSQQLRAEQKQLNTEWHKLLLEQQTFGATTRIGGRAVVSMGMYSPKPNEVITVNMADLADKQVNNNK